MDLRHVQTLPDETSTYSMHQAATRGDQGTAVGERTKRFGERLKNQNGVARNINGGLLLGLGLAWGRGWEN